jgi:hypothetical protein
MNAWEIVSSTLAEMYGDEGEGLGYWGPAGSKIVTALTKAGYLSADPLTLEIAEIKARLERLERA